MSWPKKEPGAGRDQRSASEKVFWGLPGSGNHHGKDKELYRAATRTKCLKCYINRELAALKRMLNLGAKCTPPKVDRLPHVPMLKENNARQEQYLSEQKTQMVTKTVTIANFQKPKKPAK